MLSPSSTSSISSSCCSSSPSSSATHETLSSSPASPKNGVDTLGTIPCTVTTSAVSEAPSSSANNFHTLHSIIINTLHNYPVATSRTTGRTTNSHYTTSSSSSSTKNRITTYKQQRQKAFLLAGLVGLLGLASLLAILFVPRDEHSPRNLHPLTSISLAKPQDQDGTAIRYLTFGSSSTWGQGLEHPQQDAFPHLLSPTVHNVAARVGGLALSAICTQSIVGNDNVYDVIVVEFSDADDAESLRVLGTRLRQRFPIARLVFVRLWSPQTHFVYRSSNGDGELSLQEWWKQRAKQQQEQSLFSEGAQDAATPSPILGNFDFESNILNSNPGDWSFRDFSQHSSKIDQAILDVGGLIFNLPFPTTTASIVTTGNDQRHDSIPLILTNHDFMDWFQPDNALYLSPKGHHVVAQGIQNVLSSQQPLDPTSIVQMQNRNQVGSWGTGDACTMWYASGDYSSLRSRRRASLVDFSKDSTSGEHKHAVEMSRRGGSMIVTNPFEEPRMLYLTYMTAAATATTTLANREYPRTKISIGGKPSVLINPVYDKQETVNSSGASLPRLHGDDAHVPRTTAVGLVPPGRTELRLDSLDPTSTSRFRLVGVHFLNKGKVPIPFEFALEPDLAHR